MNYRKQIIIKKKMALCMNCVVVGTSDYVHIWRFMQPTEFGLFLTLKNLFVVKFENENILSCSF